LGWKPYLRSGDDDVLAENLLIDLTGELTDFLRVTTMPFSPVFDLREVLDNVFSSLTMREFAEENLTEYAICFAYDAFHGDVRIEEGDIPRGPHRDRFNAVMRLGRAIHHRLENELHAYRPPYGFFPYVFAEVFNDHLVRLSKADFEEFSTDSILAYFAGPRHRL
jgi:hypothetical protein